MTTPNFRLDDDVALVTGAGGGIGRAISLAIAGSGARVACVDLNVSAAEETAAQIERSGGRAVSIGADVANPNSMLKAVVRAEETIGDLSLAVNCAGIEHQAPAEKLAITDWERVIRVNLTGVFLSSQAEARVMLPRARGAIVNIASMSGTISNRGTAMAHYNSSKAGVAHLSKTLAAEWISRGVRVNSVSPGYVATAMTAVEEWDGQHAQWKSETPLGRFARPDEIAGPCVFLLSESASNCVGVDLLVDGGFTLW